MKKLNYDFNINDDFILNKFQNSVVLDIETTGLSRKYNNIFLIGLCEIKKNSSVELFFAEDLEEEYDILKEIKPYLDKNIITFNGNSFDIPFIKEKYDFYNMDFPQVEGFDLYRYIKNYKHILNLKNYKQKSLEEYLNINRDEFISGAEVVSSYRDYLINKDYENFKDVIVHNRDDIIGLTNSLKVVEEIEEINSIEIKEKLFIINTINFDKNTLIINGKTNFKTTSYFNYFNYSLISRNKSFTITIPTHRAKYDNNRFCNFVLKSEFPNVQNKIKIPSPKEILILKLDGILFKNVYEIVKRILEENF